MDFNSHAHVERDMKLCYTNAILDDFNSHAHVERDFITLEYYKAIEISTHTLTWSVTY